MLIDILRATAEDPFQILQTNRMMPPGGSGNSEIYSNAISLYNLFLAIGIVGIFTTLIICGLKMAFMVGPQERQKAKSEITLIFVKGIILFGFPFFASLAYRFALTFK